MKRYSPEYWLAHYEYVMGHKSKIEIDTSNENWTRNNITKILNNEFPYGMTGTNGAKGFIAYVRIYHPKRLEDIVKLMLRYIEAVRKDEKPLYKVQRYYQSIINNTF